MIKRRVYSVNHLRMAKAKKAAPKKKLIAKKELKPKAIKLGSTGKGSG